MASGKRPLFWDLAVQKIRQKSAGRGARKQLASRAEVSEPSLSRYLTEDHDRTVPRVDEAIRIVRAAGLDLGELLELGDAQTHAAEVASPHGGRSIAGVGAPLVAVNVAAGEGALPEVPDEKLYFFHESFMRRHDWSPKSRDRFACIRLGNRANAESMLPTIHPESIILIDRKRDPSMPGDRAIWLVDEPDSGLCVKRVTLERNVLTLESDNPERKYRPRTVLLEDVDIRQVLKGKVLWYATEVK